MSGSLGSGKSLQSLKAYYRKLRVFKGTVKALINLRRFPSGAVNTTSSDAPVAVRRCEHHSLLRWVVVQCVECLL